ncbi:cytochrome C [Pseudomonas putida SJTE-1]|uniref:ABC transporter substrate-binding protein n=2 Tax=Pseudomonas TaxID=286 RepID=A0A7L9GBQ2_9PSED|nr:MULTISPECIES: ABC transporter substrate-binding protein [Pseudomonas]ANI03877.1 cytochrome C [Pseudomonas putida SJTE-1]MEB3439196.1 ABC transporter substrate-binding protein [Pseudomonas sp. A2]QOJ89850.1 ABC transporter substrate-binding protein [Pseudomonas taiwanensis]WQQ34784.1 ABC transporter substrate-binding protein [Pseudomonas putida]
MGRLGNWPLWHHLLWERSCVAKGLRSSPGSGSLSAERGARCARLSRRKAAPTGLAIWLTCVLGMASSTSALALDLTDHEQAGKRLYREGVSSSDAQLQARVGASGITVPASVLPCASCHGNDGRGRAEGGVRPPSLDWQHLALGQGPREANGRRYPAYTDSSLARAIQQGIDPAGNRLDPAMPRFELTLADQRNLTAYLKRLAEERDPGVEEGVLRLGTLLPASGPLADAGQVVRAVLEDGVGQLNQQGGIHGRRLELVVLDPGSDPVSAERALQQLLEQKRVFALIAPLAPMLDQRLTTLLAPQNVPMIGSTPRSGGSAQIFDPLPGLPEQLLSLAGHARVALGLAPDELRVVYAGNEHAALAEQVRERLRQQGWAPPAIQAFDGQAVDGQGIVFLGRAQAFAELAAALQVAGREPYLFAASSQVAGAVARLPAQWSQRLFLAYPYVPEDWTEQGQATLAGLQQRQGLDPRQVSLQVNTLCALRLLSEALKQIGRDASREQLIAALEGLHDVPTGLTPALGFGPGRRQGMAGAHVVAVALPGPRFTAVTPYRPVPVSP